MKKTQLIVLVLVLCSVVACTTEREEVNSSPKLNTSTSVSAKRIRSISDTLKLNQSQNGITTKASAEGEEVTLPIDGAETIDPTKPKDKPW